MLYSTVVNNKEVERYKNIFKTSFGEFIFTKKKDRAPKIITIIETYK